MSARRSLPDGTDLIRDRILEALRGKSPLSPAELVAKVKEDKVVVRRRVQALEREGLVTCTGVTMSRQIHLGKVKASTMPKFNGSMKSASAGNGASALDHVKMLDITVLNNLRGAGRTGRTLRELKITHPDESEPALERSLTRLKVKQKVHVDEGGRWTAS